MAPASTRVAKTEAATRTPKTADNVSGGNVVSCGAILDVAIFWMWRNFICGHILDVKKFEMHS